MFKAKLKTKALFWKIIILAVFLVACGQEAAPLEVVEFPTASPI